MMKFFIYLQLRTRMKILGCLKKIYNMIYSLLNDELSIRKNVRGVDYEDGVYTIRVIGDCVMQYFKYINLLRVRSSDSSDLYTILDRIEEV